MIELKNSKTTYIGRDKGRDKSALDCFLGAVQMQDPVLGWVDIKPRIERIGDIAYVRDASYDANVNMVTGAREFYPDKDDHSKYLKLPAVPLVSAFAKQIVNTPTMLDESLLPNQIAMPTAWGTIKISFTNTGMEFGIEFTGFPPTALFGSSSRILLDVDTNLDIAKLLTAKEGMGIPRPRLILRAPKGIKRRVQEKFLDWSFKNGQLELGFDIGTWQPPFILKNTTIDYQVSASADDAGLYEGSWYTNRTYLPFSNLENEEQGERFLAVTIATDRQIDVAYMSFLDEDDSGTCGVTIYGEDSATPATYTTQANFEGRALTTASVGWAPIGTGAGWHNTPSLVPIAAELYASYDYSAGLAMAFQTRPLSGTGWRSFFSQNQSGGVSGPKLHLEHSAAAAGGYVPYPTSERRGARGGLTVLSGGNQ